MMSKRANPAAVGAFVLGALALVVGGVIFFGGGKFLANTERFVIFFDGSVNGLQVGSQVKLQGVPIGEVIDIRALVDAREWDLYTQTTIQIDPTRFERIGLTLSLGRERAELLVKQGVRARLELQSLITGQLYVALDFLPNAEARVKAVETEYVQIPAVPSKSQEIQEAYRQVTAKLKDLNLENLIDNVQAAVEGIGSLVNDPELKDAVANLNTTLEDAQGAVADARRVMQSIDGRIGPVSESVVAALSEVRGTLKGARGTLASVDSFVEPGSPTSYQVSTALQELTTAARAISRLASYIEENPNSLVFGRESKGD
jgi:paraquat-inducible protein B